MVLYTGGSGGCYGTPVCISERPVWLIRHLKQKRQCMGKILVQIQYKSSSADFVFVTLGGADLVAC